MTIEQLKRHIDRRLRNNADKNALHRLELRLERIERSFDRDRRTKSDKADVAELERQMDARLEAIDARLVDHDRRFGGIDRRLDTILGQLGSFGRLLATIRDRYAKTLADHEARLRDSEVVARR